MSVDYDTYCNLAERIDKAFPEIDDDICVDLGKNSSEYVTKRKELGRLQDDFPVIVLLTEGCEVTKSVSISVEEHEALLQYYNLKNDVDYMERKQIYFRGQLDCYSYLKMITGIHIE